MVSGKALRARATAVPDIAAIQEGIGRMTVLGRKFEFIGKEAAIDRRQRLNGS